MDAPGRGLFGPPHPFHTRILLFVPEFYLNATRNVYLRALRSASADRGYTHEEASWSLYLDVDKGEDKSLRSRAAQWGINRNVLIERPKTGGPSHWEEITRLTWMISTSDERQWTPQAERYVELAGLIYDPGIAPRARLSMQGAETYRPPADIVERLRARGQPNAGQKKAKEQPKTIENGAETQGGQPKGNQKKAKEQQHTNTSSASKHQEPPPKASPSPPRGGLCVGVGLPDWIDAEAWSGFVEMRRKIRKPMTERAARLTVRDLEKLKAAGQDPNAVLDQSTKRCWQGVFPLEPSSLPPKPKATPAGVWR